MDGTSPLFTVVFRILGIKRKHSSFTLLRRSGLFPTPLPRFWQQVEYGGAAAAKTKLHRITQEVYRAFAERTTIRSCRLSCCAVCFAFPPMNVHVPDNEEAPVPSLSREGCGAQFIQVPMKHRHRISSELRPLISFRGAVNLRRVPFGNGSISGRFCCLCLVRLGLILCFLLIACGREYELRQWILSELVCLTTKAAAFLGSSLILPGRDHGSNCSLILSLLHCSSIHNRLLRRASGGGCYCNASWHLWRIVFWPFGQNPAELTQACQQSPRVSGGSWPDIRTSNNLYIWDPELPAESLEEGDPLRYSKARAATGQRWVHTDCQGAQQLTIAEVVQS
mmetsp:Transcript_102417/g.298655  ORF Transcript_102417/g.298655 Transcript_102417/m.298655 type:complete len:337 (+) Transcript_102417:173-1183(+)